VAFFSHRHAAVLAGLGTFGMNNMILTREFGPRVRLGTILTSADIEPDPVMEGDLCIQCSRCISHCPAQALEEGSYPDNLTDKKACTENSANLNRHYISPCGICIKVCPVGHDREFFNRTDAGMYDRDTPLKDSWDHVRRYGTR
jgi:epoxyqueuosine reductase QueG